MSSKPARLAIISLSLVGAMGLSACASGGSVGTVDAAATAEGVEYATAEIEAASVDPDFLLEAPAFDMNGIDGKTIFNIPNTSAVPYIVSMDEEAAALAESYGATWVEYANQGSPTEHSAGVDQAISQGADVIVLAQGINGELIVPALERAKAAGVPVVITHTYQNGDPIPEALTDLVAAQMTAPFNESGRLSADWAIKETNGEGDILLINSSEVPPSNGIIAAMEDEIATHCPGCSVKTVNVPVADWATKIATTVQSEILANPELDYILPVYDSMTLFVESGVVAAGKTGSVFTASFNGTPAVLKILQEGEVLTMDVGEDITWLAWASLDQIGRVLTGTEPIADGDEMTPLKVITKENVDETGVPPVPGQGYGNAYVTGYEALWGLPE